MPGYPTEDWASQVAFRIESNTLKEDQTVLKRQLAALQVYVLWQEGQGAPGGAPAVGLGDKQKSACKSRCIALRNIIIIIIFNILYVIIAI